MYLTLMCFTFYWVPVEPYCNVNFVNLQRRILADRINRNNRTIGKDLKKDLQIANDNLNVPPVQDWPPPDLLGVRLLREPLGEGHRQAGVARGHPGAGAVNQSEHSIFIVLANHRRVLYDLMLVWTRWCTMPGSPATWCTAVARWE